MPDGPAADSLRYALNPELVKLYGVTYLGYLFSVYSQNAFHLIADTEPLETLVELPFVLFGLALFFGGLVGVFHRVLSDTALSGRR
jgi:hypothetical protein